MNDFMNETLADALLVYARALLSAELRGAPAPTANLPPGAASGGFFVTLYDEEGELRGSLGTTAPDAPLSELAPRLIRAAAFADPRFPPLEAAELDRCRLAVTLLGPPMRIASPDEVVPGVSALRVKAGIFGGTTLPEVAWGRGWDAATYLAYACRKAGVHALAWRDPATEVLAFPSGPAAVPFSRPTPGGAGAPAA